MSRISHALILAAGRGKRMGPLTDVIPKPMAPLQGQGEGMTLISREIGALTGRIPHIHITVGYKKAMLAQHVIEKGASTVINTEGRSNSWWIHHTILSRLDEPVLVMTCDNVMELDFELIERDYLELGEPPCMLVPVAPVAGLEGDFIFLDKTDGQGARIVTELDRNKPSDIYCSGLQVINPASAGKMTSGEGDFYAFWRELISKRALKAASVYPKKWISIDTFEQLSRFNQGVAEAAGT